MKLAIKWSLSKAKAKLRQWERKADRAMLEDLSQYGKAAAQAMIKCTPPGNGKISPARALKLLKARIQQDFEGDGRYKYDEEDLYWYHDRSGHLRAGFEGDGYSTQAPPFRVITGRMGKVKAAAMHVGKYGVQYVQQNLGEFMASAGQYPIQRTRKGVYRMRWHGVRHITTRAAVNVEIRRRHHLVGKLMNGWEPLAKKAKVKLPAAATRGGKGSAKVRRDGKHKAVLDATNSGHYPGLQRIVNRQVPGIRKKNAALAKKRAKALAKSL